MHYPNEAISFLGDPLRQISWLIIEARTSVENRVLEIFAFI